MEKESTGRVIKFRAYEGGKYEIGSDGSVWSTDFNHTGQRRELKQYPDRDGYRVVWFTIKGKRSIHPVRRLVAYTFLGERPAGLVINHKNGIRDDDRSENLEYVTSRQNTLHGWRVNGRQQSQAARRRASLQFRGRRNPKAKITREDARSIRTLRRTGVFYKDIAPKFGISVAQVGAICTNRFWL